MARSRKFGSVVEHQLFLHVNATLPLFNYLAVNVDLPMALYQAGESPVVGSTTFTSPSVVQLGDVSVGARGRFWGEYHDPFQIGVGATLWVPSGPADAGTGDFVGSGTARGLFQVLVGGRVQERFVWSAALGPQIGPVAQRTLTLGRARRSAGAWQAGCSSAPSASGR